jgi:hypothetical protein
MKIFYQWIMPKTQQTLLWACGIELNPEGSLIIPD